MVFNHPLFRAALLIIALIYMPVHSSGESPAKRYRVSFTVGTVELKFNGASTTLKNGDYVKEGDILFIDKKSMVELRPEPGDARFTITGPVIYRCSGFKLARDFSRNNLIYRLYSKMSRETYHYYPRTVVSGVRGENDAKTEERNKQQSAELKEAIDLFRNAQLDESWRKFETLAAGEGLQRHVRHLIDFYRAEILFAKMEYSGALDLYLSIYKTRNAKFQNREIALCRAILCSVYTDKPDRARELIAEYEEIYGKRGAYAPLLDELKKDLVGPGK